jgi:hypothetical protein
MAYNEQIAKRISEQLQISNIDFEVKKMFGGIAYMIKNKMSIGIVKDELMIRVMPGKYDTALQLDYAKPMDFTGRVMKGFLMIERKGFETDEALQNWLDIGIEFGKFGIVKRKKK